MLKLSAECRFEKLCSIMNPWHLTAALILISVCLFGIANLIWPNNFPSSPWVIAKEGLGIAVLIISATSFAYFFHAKRRWNIDDETSYPSSILEGMGLGLGTYLIVVIVVIVTTVIWYLLHKI